MWRNNMISSNELNGELNDLLRLTEKVCLYHLHNIEDAQDISQCVILEFYTNQHKIKNSKAWVKKVASNKCYEFMRKNTRYREMIGKLKVEKQLISNSDLTEINETDKLSYKNLILSISDLYLPQKDKELFMDYINCGCDLNKWLETSGYKFDSGRRKIYKIKKDIVAWINQYRGVIRGKELIGAHLNENIINFVKRFQMAVDIRSWEPIKNYLASGLQIPEMFELPFYDDKEYHVYRIDKGEFKIALTYFDDSGKASAFFFEIRVIPPHSILVTRFPQPVEKIVKLTDKVFPKEIKEALTPLPDGSYRYSAKELNALLKKHNINLKTVFEPDKK